ncbi:hypothetical protein CERSUDRAFT_73502 [Gelatoporia subvermispora B]|uniref:Protein-S-isoprenylcysteine O-methyltransferase n=1 Tax=Ceriporiopsis subvermispora (strain B) TaxID=914234 RepID=M2RGQ4_CERS8|nr:hypothetical protein CERSUDRAFT_73502 [Gelatoporia subvermispora B]
MTGFFMHSNLLKIPLYMAALIATHITLTPPPRSVARKNLKENLDLMSKLNGLGAVRFKKIIVFLVAIYEMVSILAEHLPLYNLDSANSNIRLTKTVLCSMLLTITGGIGRCWCHHRSGPSFSYRHLIRGEHTHQTGGLYAVVRHPSYLAYIVWAVGAMIWMWADGSWLHECGILDTWLGKAVLGGWTINVLLTHGFGFPASDGRG